MGSKPLINNEISVLMESEPCPLCGPVPATLVLEGADLLHDLPGRFSVQSCTNCGLLRTDPRPTATSIGFYYPSDYGPYAGTVVSTVNGGAGLKSKLVNIAKRIFDTKAHAVPQSSPGRLLEIGCASGSYLHAMAQQGWKVEGIEFSDDAAENARALGFDVKTGALETVDKAAGSFDLITGWMVLEHLHQPLAVLVKLREWIKPTGQLAISVPNAGSAERRLFGSRWYALQVPTHLYHYDPVTIRKLLAAAGWNVTQIQHHRTLANAVASTGYLLRDKGWTRLGQILIDFPERGGRIGAIALFPFAWIAALIGQTGRMTVWAEPV